MASVRTRLVRESLPRSVHAIHGPGPSIAKSRAKARKRLPRFPFAAGRVESLAAPLAARPFVFAHALSIPLPDVSPVPTILPYNHKDVPRYFACVNKILYFSCHNLGGMSGRDGIRRGAEPEDFQAEHRIVSAQTEGLGTRVEQAKTQAALEARLDLKTGRGNNAAH
jgi:hypothetical protein